jgi:hypothetical protein
MASECSWVIAPALGPSGLSFVALRVGSVPPEEALRVTRGLASPKSRTLGCPRLVTKMFAGLMSRWRMPAARSGPVMEKLHAWLTAQLQEKKAERNPGLGQANSYLLNHWQELTLFLCQPGAPLDNNICERPLQKVILHRKNALFYKEPEWRSSRDLFMSLIHTCELSDTNPGLSDSVTAARLGAGRKSPRLDAMELLRDAGARERPTRSSSCLRLRRSPANQPPVHNAEA